MMTDTQSARLPFREELVRSIPALRRYARKLGGSDLAEDILQDALERALRYEAAYTAQGAMNAWLKQIARNVSHDLHKRREEYVLFCDIDDVENEDGDLDDFAARIPDETAIDGEDAIDAANIAKVAEKVLAPDVWACLSMTATGLSSKQIAAELCISDVAVRQHVSRGRKALRALQEDGPKSATRSVATSLREQSLNGNRIYA